MDVLDQQFQSLKAKYPGADLKRVPNGTALVTIPGYKLPVGWSEPTTTIYFIVPVGFPVARPDTFWTDPLRLATGGVPQSAGQNQAEGLPRPDLTWFSWHPSVWSANADTLLSYLHMIALRLREAK